MCQELLGHVLEHATPHRSPADAVDASAPQHRPVGDGADVHVEDGAADRIPARRDAFREHARAVRDVETACAANASARIVRACRGSRTSVDAATRPKPSASATSSPAPGTCLVGRPRIRGRRRPSAARSSAAICASRSSAIEPIGGRDRNRRRAQTLPGESGGERERRDQDVCASASDMHRAAHVGRKFSGSMPKSAGSTGDDDAVELRCRRGPAPRDSARTADRGAGPAASNRTRTRGRYGSGACTRATTATSPVLEPHQVARRIDAEQLHEPPHQVLVELRAVVALQHGEDALGREGLLIGALRPHRVVDVGDAAQHRADVERTAA